MIDGSGTELCAPEVQQQGRHSYALLQQPDKRHCYARGGAHVTGLAHVGEMAQLRKDVAHPQQACVPLQGRQPQSGFCCCLPAPQ
jgi:hypothetical protein